MDYNDDDIDTGTDPSHYRPEPDRYPDIFMPLVAKEHLDGMKQRKPAMYGAALESSVAKTPEENYRLAKQAALNWGATEEEAEEIGTMSKSMMESIMEVEVEFERYPEILSEIEELIHSYKAPLASKSTRKKLMTEIMAKLLECRSLSWEAALGHEERMAAIIGEISHFMDWIK